MSLTAHLLLGLPINLPAGQTRVIYMDKKSPYTRGHNSATRLTNTEAVFNAIADGFVTIFAIAGGTGLSEVTVKRLIHDLEDWPAGPRIKRTSHGTAHRRRFEVVTPVGMTSTATATD